MGEYKVMALEVLKGQRRPEEARDILTRVAKQVEPLMAKYQWRVGLLAEFFPKNPGLLGLNYNRGQKILLRLRQHDTPGSFLDMESILGTMLHELVHMEIGEHSDKFYMRLEALTAECEQLMVKGLNALTSRHVPYEGEGHTLGGGGGGGAAGSAAVRAARAAAAERRRQRGAVMPGGGQRLGGRGGSGGAEGPLSGKESLRERIRSAAERRALDSARCRTATQQANAGPGSGAKDNWACALCTFRNPGAATKCGVCDSPRGAATQDASQGLADVFIDLDDEEDSEEDENNAAGGDGGGGKKGGGKGDSKLPPPPPPPPSSSSRPASSSTGGGGNGGKQGRQQEEEEERKKQQQQQQLLLLAAGGWRCEGTGVGCGLLNEAGAASCARCGHTRRARTTSCGSGGSSNPFKDSLGGVGRKRPLDLGEGVEDEAEEAMLAAALAASVGEKGQGAGAEGEDEDAALARALAASAASWRCGACTFENVGGGVKCTLCGTARGGGGGGGGGDGEGEAASGAASGAAKGGGGEVVDLTALDD